MTTNEERFLAHTMPLLQSMLKAKSEAGGVDRICNDLGNFKKKEVVKEGMHVCVRKRVYKIEKIYRIEAWEIDFLGRRVRQDGTLVECLARIVGPWDGPWTLSVETKRS